MLYNFSMVEGFVDKYGLSQQQQQRLQHPPHPSQLAHPLDTVLHHRRQQQQEDAADTRSIPLAGAAHLAAAGQRQHPQLHPQQQQRRQLLQVEERADSTAHPAGGSGAASGAVSAASTPASSSSSSNGAGDGRSGDPTLTRPQRRLRATFYVWVNVMNLVGISSLWAKTADAFSPDAGARLFGFISAGATLGQLAGSLIAMMASWVAGLMLSQVQANGGVAVGSSSSKSAAGSGSSTGRAAPASSLLLVAAVLQLAAAQLVTRIRPVVMPAAAGAGAAAVVVPDSSSGSGGDRAASPQLVRRSWSGGSAVVAPINPGFGQRTVKQPSQLSAGQGGAGASDWGAASAAPPGSGPAAAVLIHSSRGAAAASAVSKCLPGNLLSGLADGQGFAARANGGSSGSSNSTGVAAAVLNGGTSSQKAGKGSAGFQMWKVLTGFQLIWRSPYLLLVCSNLLLTYVSRCAPHDCAAGGAAATFCV